MFFKTIAMLSMKSLITISKVLQLGLSLGYYQNSLCGDLVSHNTRSSILSLKYEFCGNDLQGKLLQEEQNII